MIAMTTLEAQELSAKLKVPAPAKYSLVSGVNKAAFFGGAVAEVAARSEELNVNQGDRVLKKAGRARARAGSVCARDSR